MKRKMFIMLILSISIVSCDFGESDFKFINIFKTKKVSKLEPIKENTYLINYLDEANIKEKNINSITKLLNNNIIEIQYIKNNKQDNKEKIERIYYSVPAEKILAVEDMLRFNYPKIIKYIDDKPINFNDVNYNNFKINENEIIFGDYEELTLNLEKYKSVFKPFLGLPSLYTGEKIIVPTEKIDPNKKHIAFTFDDGPANKYHDLIRELFDKNNQKATFCVVGSQVNRHKDKLITAYKNGHEIINHTYTHPNLTKLDNEKMWEDINKTSNLIMQTIGYDVKYMRPPYGAFNNRVKDMVKYKLALWTIDSQDWKSRDVDTIINRVLPNIKDGDIVLFHDLYKESYEAVKQMVPILLEQNYQFITYSDLMKLKREKLKKQKENENIQNNN